MDEADNVRSEERVEEDSDWEHKDSNWEHKEI